MFKIRKIRKLNSRFSFEISKTENSKMCISKKSKRAWAKRAPLLWQKKWEGMTYIKYTKTHTNISKYVEK